MGCCGVVKLLHVLRVIGAGLLGKLVAGAAAGIGARLVMFLIRLLNPTHNGMTTHSDAVVGRWTVDGTLAVVTGGMFEGIFGAIVYLIVRRWVPGRGWRKGLLFGLVLLVLIGPMVFDGDYEYFRYIPPWASVTLFALLFPLYGVVQAPVTERLGAGAQGPPRNRFLKWGGYVVLGALVVASTVEMVQAMHWLYGFF